MGPQHRDGEAEAAGTGEAKLRGAGACSSWWLGPCKQHSGRGPRHLASPPVASGRPCPGARGPCSAISPGMKSPVTAGRQAPRWGSWPAPGLTLEESSDRRRLGRPGRRVSPPEGPRQPPPAVVLRRETDGPVVAALMSGVAGQTRLHSSGRV